MLLLTRTVRFCVNPGHEDDAPSGDNSFAGLPAMRGLGRYYELDVVCRGEADETTGYFIDIKTIDRAVRGAVIPLVARACRDEPTRAPESLLPTMLDALAGELGDDLHAVRWRLTPFYALRMSAEDRQTVLLTQQFDFAAAHRLHVPGMSDEENRRVFGKCNNAAGHGHNYRVEPEVAVPLSAKGDPWFSLADLERVTREAVIDHFDHKNLSVDLPEFTPPEGVNASVEHIARVAFDRLAAALRGAFPDVRLVRVTVWETEKTSCTYPAAAISG